jgi:hypothetical protein
MLHVCDQGNNSLIVLFLVFEYYDSILISKFVLICTNYMSVVLLHTFLVFSFNTPNFR